MELIPAIDLLGGNVVRLHKGNYDNCTVFDRDPVGLAKRYEDSGARTLHVVDLGGARSGKPEHQTLIERLIAQTSLEVQVGGGVRDDETASAWWKAGAARVVVGTAAAKNPSWGKRLCAQNPGKVVVAVDLKGGRVATDGWEKDSGLDGLAFAKEVDSWSPAALLVTIVERDGTGIGPDISTTRELQDHVQADVIASGGIGSVSHIEALRNAGLRKAVVGKLLYQEGFDFEKALSLAAHTSDPSARPSGGRTSGRVA